MGITIREQAVFLLTSCLLGMALGALYDLFRVFRVLFFRGRVAVFFQDLLFWLLCALITFGFLLLQNHGTFRVPGLLAEALGAALYYNTAGRAVERWVKRTEREIKRRARAAARAVGAPLRRGARAARSGMGEGARRAALFAKKQGKVFKIRLQVRRAMLYNQLRPTKKPKRKSG